MNAKYGATAPKLYDGYALIRDFGCFGCHEINGFDGSRPIGPDLRLEPQTAEEAARIAADPNQVAGTLRKVGPSLRHVASKTTPDFIAYWTEMPKRFRPDTRMPQFFENSNQTDHLASLLQPVELNALAAFLSDRSQPLSARSAQGGLHAGCRAREGAVLAPAAAWPATATMTRTSPAFVKRSVRT
ncbi:MAG: hypothetical protein U0992_24335 [Planctomycetaceae bacterium]